MLQMDDVLNDMNSLHLSLSNLYKKFYFLAEIFFHL